MQNFSLSILTQIAPKFFSKALCQTYQFTLILFLANFPLFAQSFLYVSEEGKGTLSIYRINPNSGNIQFEKSVNASGGPGSFTFSPNKRFLYLGQQASKSLTAYSVNFTDGNLTPINTISIPFKPVYVSMDVTGRFLLSVSYFEHQLAIHAVDSNGKILSEPVELKTLGKNLHAILTTKDNRFLYIPSLGTGEILQFAFNPVNGKITSLSPPVTLTESFAGPRHMIFHGTKNLAYVLNEWKNSVSVFQHDSVTGHLTHLQTLSTLPKNFNGTNTAADIHITPNQKFLYTSNRGHESLAAFRVDTSTGLLTLLDFYPTARNPRDFTIDPSGNYLYAGGYVSDTIVTYRIDGKAGTLEKLASNPTGRLPGWLIAIQFDEKPLSLRSQVPAYPLVKLPSNYFKLYYKGWEFNLRGQKLKIIQ